MALADVRAGRPVPDPLGVHLGRREWAPSIECGRNLSFAVCCENCENGLEAPRKQVSNFNPPGTFLASSE